MPEAVERFWKFVAVNENGCWLWTGSTSDGRYGAFAWNGKVGKAHRWSYEFHRGPIPDGAVTDHLCRNGLCVNPLHLEIVTQQENVLRGNGRPALQARQTHCIYGHEFSAENTYIKANGARQCKTCRRAIDKIRYRRKQQCLL